MISLKNALATETTVFDSGHDNLVVSSAPSSQNGGQVADVFLDQDILSYFISINSTNVETFKCYFI